jgi:hypothetical protein
MADTTGPISTLPGSIHSVPKGVMCDTEGHEKTPATRRVQGETDSFGSEMNDMCEECYRVFCLTRETEDTSGRCDWCGGHSTERKSTRDYDEGMSGPVYMVCKGCRQKQYDEACKELEEEEPCFYDDREDYL